MKLKLKNRSITNPHRSLPYSLGALRRPESNYDHLFHLRRGILHNHHYLMQSLFRSVNEGAVPGYNGDPFKKRVTQAMAQRRFEKWCEISNNRKTGRSAIRIFWRAKGISYLSVSGYLKKPESLWRIERNQVSD